MFGGQGPPEKTWGTPTQRNLAVSHTMDDSISEWRGGIETTSDTEGGNIASYHIQYQPAVARWLHGHAVVGTWGEGLGNRIGIWKMDKDVGAAVELSSIPADCDVSDIAVLPDGKSFLAATESGTVTVASLYDSRDGLCIEAKVCLPLHQGPCTSIDATFADVILTAGEDGRVYGVDLNKASKTKLIREDGAPVMCIKRISPSELAVGTRGGLLKLYDMRQSSRAPIVFKQLDGSDGVQCLCFHSSEHNYVVTGTTEGRVMVWDRRSIHAPRCQIKMHEDDIWGLSFDPHPHRVNSLLTCGGDGMVKRCDFSARGKVQAGHGLASSFMPSADTSPVCEVLAEARLPVSSMHCSSREGEGVLCAVDSHALLHVALA
eukprot:Rmarinus@m.12369